MIKILDFSLSFTLIVFYLPYAILSFTKPRGRIFFPDFRCSDPNCQRAIIKIELSQSKNSQVKLLRNHVTFSGQLDSPQVHHFIAVDNQEWLSGSVSVRKNSSINGLFHSGHSLVTIVPFINHTTSHVINHDLLADGQNHWSLHLLSIFDEPLDDRDEFGPQFVLYKLSHRRVLGFSQFSDVPMFIQLVMVNDHPISEKYAHNKKLIVEMNRELTNMANALFMPLDIKLVLVDSIIWGAKDGFRLSLNLELSLKLLFSYRKNHLAKYLNFTTPLLTTARFGTTYGFSMMGSLCNRYDSGAVVSLWPNSLPITAIILAHEIGHLLGMWHDDQCYCHDEACIMRGLLGSYKPKRWSKCSFNDLKTLRESGFDRCLYDPPVFTISAICGNGILEDGEECDCGLKDCGICCDALTCKLINGAKCGTGRCCDKKTCRPFARDDLRVCRISDNQCDIQEFCDGLSEFCPKDNFRHDGFKCAHDGFCFQGSCGARQAQCKRIWGPKSTVAPLECYDLNKRGFYGFNCGSEPETNIPIPCPDEDILCGRLQCETENSDLSVKFLSGSISAQREIISFNHHCKSIFSHSDPRPNDPGLVPNGAQCASDRLCINSRCTPLEEILVNPCANCSNETICDNHGHCRCENGLLWPECLTSEVEKHKTREPYFEDWLNSGSLKLEYFTTKLLIFVAGFFLRERI